MASFWRNTYLMYRDGFRNMTVGRYLWAIILVKLAIMFLVLRLFFFPDILERDYDNDADRAEAVRENLTGSRKSATITTNISSEYFIGDNS